MTVDRTNEVPSARRPLEGRGTEPGAADRPDDVLPGDRLRRHRRRRRGCAAREPFSDQRPGAGHEPGALHLRGHSRSGRVGPRHLAERGVQLPRGDQLQARLRDGHHRVPGNADPAGDARPAPRAGREQRSHPAPTGGGHRSPTGLQPRRSTRHGSARCRRTRPTNRTGRPGRAARPAGGTDSGHADVRSAVGHRHRSRAVRVGLRPVVRGRKGGWIRTGISWDKISAHQLRQLGPRADHVRLLREINLLHSLSDHRAVLLLRHQLPATWTASAAGASGTCWPRHAAAGLEIVQSGRGQLPGDGGPRPGGGRARGRPGGGDLVITPTVPVDGQPVGAVEFALLGDPVHGVAYWPSGRGHQQFRTDAGADRDSPSPTELRQFLAGGAVRIPRQDEQNLRPGLPAPAGPAGAGGVGDQRHRRSGEASADAVADRHRSAGPSRRPRLGMALPDRGQRQHAPAVVAGLRPGAARPGQ